MYFELNSLWVTFHHETLQHEFQFAPKVLDGALSRPVKDPPVQKHCLDFPNLDHKDPDKQCKTWPKVHKLYRQVCPHTFDQSVAQKSCHEMLIMDYIIDQLNYITLWWLCKDKPLRSFIITMTPLTTSLFQLCVTSHPIFYRHSHTLTCP